MSLPLAPGMGEEAEFENAVSRGDDLADLAYPDVELPDASPAPVSPSAPSSPSDSWQKMSVGQPEAVAQPDGSPSEAPTLPTALKRHSSPVREKVMAHARTFGISDDDPIWPVIMAMREGDERLLRAEENFVQAVEWLEATMDELPAKMREAVDGVTLGYQMNNRVAQENKAVIDKVEGSVKEFTAEVAAMRRDRKWLYGWMIGLTGLVIAIAGWSTLENSITRKLAGEFDTDRLAVVGEAKVLQGMQRLVIERAQVNAIREELKMQYQGFKDLVGERGMTAEMQEKKAAIEGAFAALQQRETNLEKKEKQAYEKKY
ncbi:MAG: hypothetical protein IAE94_05270 [Chthoniobacterales bacterium]|nr:hypothetical protein [Chthoniobacterales bacterium]